MLTWTASLGFVASAAVHVFSFVVSPTSLNTATAALFAGPFALLPLSMMLWAAHADENGVGMWDKHAQNRLAADAFNALPPWKRRALWAALAYGLACFVLAVSHEGFLVGPLAAFYLCLAVMQPRPVGQDVSRSIRKRD